jgi:hypothetical protein
MHRPTKDSSKVGQTRDGVIVTSETMCPTLSLQISLMGGHLTTRRADVSIYKQAVKSVRELTKGSRSVDCPE